MKKLAVLTRDWVEQGIIEPAQREDILLFEENRPGNVRKWGVYGFLVLGAAVSAIGIISLVAANWEHIPGWFKLSADLLILCFVAMMLVRSDSGGGSPLIYDAAGTFFAILCLASIGLVSQVFHAGGEPWQALFFWVLIIFPLCLTGKADILPHLWVAAFLAAFLAWSFSDSSWVSHIRGGRDVDTSAAVVTMMAPLCFLLSQLPCPSDSLKRISGIFSMWAFVFTMGATIVIDIILSAGRIPPPGAFIPAGTTALAALALMFTRQVITGREQVLIFIMAFMTCLCLFAGFTAGADTFFSRFCGAVYTVLMMAILSFIVLLRGHGRLFNILVVCIALRFFIIYLQVFGTLATTGLGLVVTGGLIAGFAILWLRRHGSIAGWLGGRFK